MYWNTTVESVLCLECSKRFVEFRNFDIDNSFLKQIKKTKIPPRSGIVPILAGNLTITFTAKHLAMIQEILRLMNENDT